MVIKNRTLDLKLNFALIIYFRLASQVSLTESLCTNGCKPGPVESSSIYGACGDLISDRSRSAHQMKRENRSGMKKG